MVDSAYDKIILRVFMSHFDAATPEFSFLRTELADAATAVGVTVPKNLGDIVYTYRYRRQLPRPIRTKEPPGMSYRIRGVGTATYHFVLGPVAEIIPSPAHAITKIPDATPGLIKRYALGDEQALLARLRYNRLIDVFLQLTWYSLQNHLRTQVKGIGQVETDELYAGLDRRGAHYVIPVQAKGGSDTMSAVQIEQDFDLCREKFPDMACRAVAAQFLAGAMEQIALFELEPDANGFAVVVRECHYRLVPQEELTSAELAIYRARSD